MISNSIVYNIDCNVGMRSYPDNYFDLAVCDIPYGIKVHKMAYLTENNTGLLVKQKNNKKLRVKSKVIYERTPWDLYTPEQSYFDELRRISKNQIIFGIDYVQWDGIGTGRIIWNKLVAEKCSFNKTETAYCSLIDNKIEIPLLYSGMMQAKSINEPTIQNGNKKLNEKRIHPCHKPVLLYDILYNKFGFEGMKIIDTHVGGAAVE